MIDANNEDFEIREKDMISYTGDKRDNRATPYAEHEELENGGTSILKKGEKNVSVKSTTKIEGEDAYTGIIHGFEPNPCVEFSGCKIGDDIRFERKHIFWYTPTAQ